MHVFLHIFSSGLALGIFSLIVTAPQAGACTRVVYHGPEDTVLTGRTMDFSIPIPANLWIFPRGVERDGATGDQTYRWTSRYGSLAVSSWDIASSDGINEKGLVGNLLWLVDTEYPAFEVEGDRPGLAVSLWLQFALDRFATVAEAVAYLREKPFVVVTDFIPGTDKYTTVHLSLSDPTGDSAIFEYIGGELMIHHDRSYAVMTNEPRFEEQLAIVRYWENISGKDFLPGTNRASDRFVRASFYRDAVTQSADPVVSVAAVFSIIRNISVPYGISVEGYPNLSTTRWRVVADQKNLRYFFEDVLHPNVFWTDLSLIDFTEGSGVRVLRADDGQVYAGEVSGRFEPAEPFRFQGID